MRWPMKQTPLKRSTKPMKRSAIKQHRPSPDRGVEFSDDVRRLVRRRAGGKCEAHCTKNCTSAIRHFHHRLLRSQGGKGTLDNCLGVCAWCHSWIHDHPLESYMRGWLIRGTGVSQR
jgi:hypothetical protein